MLFKEFLRTCDNDEILELTAIFFVFYSYLIYLNVHVSLMKDFP